MQTMDALLRMLDRSHMSRYALSKSMGKSTGYVQSALNRGGDMGCMTMSEMARHLGYTLLLRGHGEEIEIGGEDADTHQGSADRR